MRAFLLQTDDNNGQDEALCSLPYYYFGTVPDADICGDWVRPRNVGLETLTAVTADGTRVDVGQAYAFMTVSVDPFTHMHAFSMCICTRRRGQLASCGVHAYV